MYLLTFHVVSSTLFSRFVAPTTGSSSRYMGQQNSPVPSPYTPQSPATGYIQQYPHQQPPSYTQHQQIQQGESVYMRIAHLCACKKWQRSWDKVQCFHACVLFGVHLANVLLLSDLPSLEFDNVVDFEMLILLDSCYEVYCIHLSWRFVVCVQPKSHFKQTAPMWSS